jgi:hypothetical protein
MREAEQTAKYAGISVDRLVGMYCAFGVTH